MMSRFGNESPVDLLAPSLLLILLPGLTSVLFFTEAEWTEDSAGFGVGGGVVASSTDL
jgi:hypothetical protein